MKTIAYQGVEGSYSHMTALRIFGPSASFLGLAQFADVFEAVEKGSADCALLAIENTLVGTIYEVLDLLGKGSLQINGDTKTRIEHCLLSLPEAELEEIRSVYSHPKALGQCQAFFKKHPLLTPLAYMDTAAAAHFVADKRDPACAAIASQTAGMLHGLKVLRSNIEDNPENYTRFFLLSKNETEGAKSMIQLTLEHRPGSLAEILAIIAKEGVNVADIVPRPLIGRPFEYVFYLELERPAKTLLEELRNRSKTYKKLGSYETI